MTPARQPRQSASRQAPHAHNRPVIAVTMGEPAGIGPDLCLALASRALPARIVVIGDRDVLLARAHHLGTRVRCTAYHVGDVIEESALAVLHVPMAAAVTPGRLDPANSRAVLRMLEVALEHCLRSTFHAMVTAPVNKAVINDAGIAFTGHTEFLAERTGTRQVVMMLVGGGMRVALATTHLALKDVSRDITSAGLESVLRVLDRDLRARFGIARPKILVAGLNPHAGEGGHLGREELDVIAPVLSRLRAEGFDLVGPLPADTLFQPRSLETSDCVLAMYHDQGLPVLKYASFGAGVNVTLGLPIVRTSVDHGTALELAGTGKADPGSLIEAITLAAELATSRSAPAAPKS